MLTKYVNFILFIKNLEILVSQPGSALRKSFAHGRRDWNYCVVRDFYLNDKKMYVWPARFSGYLKLCFKFKIVFVYFIRPCYSEENPDEFT